MRQGRDCFYSQRPPDGTIRRPLSVPIPKLCTLVTASPVDAALHDAFGRLHNRNVFSAFGSSFVRHDLAHYLSPEFRGESWDRYIAPKRAKRIRMYHSVGASDPPTASELHTHENRRRTARDPRRLDHLQRRNGNQDQAQRQRSHGGCHAGSIRQFPPRGWLHLGFNQDEVGHMVHDGLWPIIAGRRIALNFRWAQPDGVFELYQAGSEGPQWWDP